MQNIKKNPLLNKLNHVFFRALDPYKREIAATKIWKLWISFDDGVCEIFLPRGDH